MEHPNNLKLSEMTDEELIALADNHADLLDVFTEDEIPELMARVGPRLKGREYKFKVDTDSGEISPDSDS